MKTDYDVIVVGGGPSGSSTAINCARKGLKVLLLEKTEFPRDKICGDGVSGKSVRLLRDLNLIEEIEKNEHAKMNGVIFSSPKGEVLEVEAPKKDEKQPAGYVVRRFVLDNIIFQAAKKEENVDVREHHSVVDVIKENGKAVGVKAKDKDGKVHEFKANVIVAADGASSIVATKLGAEKVEEEHHVIAVRTYYENVEGMTDKIELHFIEDVLPGYFWIFPLPNKRANVGVGMLTKELRKKRVDLKKAVDVAINSPLLKERFKNAKPLGELKGWSLPLGSKRRKGYGNGYLLVGDAASLIDPFTGEGIGNALYSGKLASEVIKKAHDKNDFSEETLKEYDKLLAEHLDEELQTMYRIQKLGRWNFLLNMAISKAKRNKELRDMISSTLVQETAMQYKKKLADPLFWLRVIFS